MQVLKFKSPSLNSELERAHPAIKDLIVDVLSLWPSAVVITSVEREPGEAGVMGAMSPHVARPCRGVDIRTRDIAPDDVEYVAKILNNRWKYDPTRPHLRVAVVEGDHLHIQVHDNTIFNRIETA